MNDYPNEKNVESQSLNNQKTTTTTSLEYETKMLESTSNDNDTLDTEVVVPLKYLGNFWRRAAVTVNSAAELPTSDKPATSSLYVMYKKVNVQISKTRHLFLKQLYFGLGLTFKFISSKHSKILTFIKYFVNFSGREILCTTSYFILCIILQIVYKFCHVILRSLKKLIRFIFRTILFIQSEKSVNIFKILTLKLTNGCKIDFNFEMS